VAAPDPNRVGGLEWTRRTGGRLTPAERRRLLGVVVRELAGAAAGRIRLATGRIAPGADAIDVTSFVPPDSALAREAERACAEQPAAVAGHSYRTWLYGRALAALDAVALDDELFYCAALVHDFGIAQVTPGRDFTLGGADRALACAAAAGVSGADGERMADAITVHPTPGIRPDRDGALGCYIQMGAMVDGAGLRLADVATANVARVLAAHPREPDFKAQLSGLIRAEARAVPDGRFGLLVRCGMPLTVRAAPFRD
jgi:hypothetical protein